MRVGFKRKLSDYEPEYLRLLNSPVKADILSYQSSYPNSEHALALQKNLNNFLKAEESIKEEQKQQYLQAKYGKVIKRKFTAGIACTAIGGAILDFQCGLLWSSLFRC
jgi:hypothetical protein